MDVTMKINFNMTDDIKKIEAGISHGLVMIGRDMNKKIRVLLKQAGRRATGDLIDSIDAEVDRFLAGFRLITGPTVSYGAAVETGSKPHWMPIDPLKKWVRVKFGLVGEEKNSMAYAVQHKIAHEGTDPTWYMRDTFRFFSPLIAAKLANEINKKL